MEVRGLGIVNLDPIVSAPLALVADLVTRDAIERLPEPDWYRLAGIAGAAD